MANEDLYAKIDDIQKNLVINKLIQRIITFRSISKKIKNYGSFRRLKFNNELYTRIDNISFNNA